MDERIKSPIYDVNRKTLETKKRLSLRESHNKGYKRKIFWKQKLSDTSENHKGHTGNPRRGQTTKVLRSSRAKAVDFHGRQKSLKLRRLQKLGLPDQAKQRNQQHEGMGV
mgnify:CR=1 FL=1